MKIGHKSTEHAVHRLSLSQIFQRYCLNPQQLYILAVHAYGHASAMGLIQYQCNNHNNYNNNNNNSANRQVDNGVAYRQGINTNSNTNTNTNGNGNGNGSRYGSGLFASTISRMGEYRHKQKRGDVENNGVTVGNYNHNFNDKAGNSNSNSKLKNNINTNANMNMNSNRYEIGSKSPLKKRNHNNNHNNSSNDQLIIDSNKLNHNHNHHTQIKGYYYNTNISNSNGYTFTNHNNNNNNNNSSSSSRQQQSSPVLVGTNAYKIINKTYNHNLNNISKDKHKDISKDKHKDKHKDKESINNHTNSKSSQHPIEFSLGSLNSNNHTQNQKLSQNHNQNSINIQCQMIVPQNLVELSFQNLDHFPENLNVQPKIGEVLPPAHTIKSFAKDVIQKGDHSLNEEKQKIAEENQKVYIGQKKQSKVQIEISYSDPSQGEKKYQNAIKKSIIQSLMGINSSRKKAQQPNEQQKQVLQYKTPDLHESLRKEKNDQNQNNPQSNKKPSRPQNQIKFDQNVKNPYASTYKESQQQLADKYRKLSDEQVVQIISSRKKSVLLKKQEKSNISNTQLMNQNKLLDMSDLDIDALLKIRKIESVVKSDNRQSQVRVGNINIVSRVQVDKQILMKNGDIINLQEKLESKVRYFLRHPQQNKNISQGNLQKSTTKQPQNLVTPSPHLNPSNLNPSNLNPSNLNSSNLNPSNLITSFVPHYCLYPTSSSSSPRNEDHMGTSPSSSRSNLFIPSNINTTKPAQSRVYEVRRVSQQSQAQSSLVFQLSANSNF